jgi:hypothetical protein
MATAPGPGDEAAADPSAASEPATTLDELPVEDPGIDVAAIEAEEVAARRRLQAIEAGRRKGGVAGAAMAGAMFALRDIYEGPPKDGDMIAVAESPDEPGDIDVDGIEVTIGDSTVWAPPPGRRGDPTPPA